MICLINDNTSRLKEDFSKVMILPSGHDNNVICVTSAYYVNDALLNVFRNQFRYDQDL